MAAQSGSRVGLPGEELRYAGSNSAVNIGIYLGGLLDQLDRGLRIVLYHETAPEHCDARRPRAGDKVSALGQGAVITRRQDQVFPALAAIRARRAKVDDPAPPEIIERAKRLGRRLEHHRTVTQVEEADEIDCVGVRRKEERLGIHQLGEHDDLVVLDPDGGVRLSNGGHVHALEGIHKRLEGMCEVQVVVDFVQGLLARHAVLELHRADSRLYFVRRGNRRRDVRGFLLRSNSWNMGCE